MPLLGSNKNRPPPTIRKQVVPVAHKPKPKPLATSTSNSTPRKNGAVKTSSSSTTATKKTVISKTLSASVEKPTDRKRKAESATPSRRSPTTTFEPDSDSDNDDIDWAALESRKRQRKVGSEEAHQDLNRKLVHSKAYLPEAVKPLGIIHGQDITSLKTGCNPLRGVKKEDVEIELQYPSFYPPEKYELVKPKDGINSVQECLNVVRQVADAYLTEDEAADQFTDEQTGLIRRLMKASNREKWSDFQAALQDYNREVSQLVKNRTIVKNLEKRRSLPFDLVELILNQVYDRCVAPHVHTLKQYDNGSDNVYGELRYPFVSKLLVEQCQLKSDQVFVDLGSGIANVVLQAALEVGCESWGCEMMENAYKLARAQKKEFKLRTAVWGLRTGSVNLREGDFCGDHDILDVLKRADVVLVNNKAFTPSLNDRLISIFLDLKPGCKVISLVPFAGENKDSGTDSPRDGYNANDLGSSILFSEKYGYHDGDVSWTASTGDYWIATRKSV